MHCNCVSMYHVMVTYKCNRKKKLPEVIRQNRGVSHLLVWESFERFQMNSSTVKSHLAKFIHDLNAYIVYVIIIA